MIKKNQRYFNWINRLTDMAIIFLSYLFAVWFWFFFLPNDQSNVAVQLARYYQFPVMMVALAYVVIFQYEGMYDSQRFGSLWKELVQLLKYFVLCTALAVGGIFLLKLSGFSRGVMMTYGVAAYIGLSLKRLLLRIGLRVARKKGYNQKHMLVVGSGTLAKKYVNCIHNNPQFGCQCMGYVGNEENPELGQHLGGYDDLEDILEEKAPDEVIIAIEQYEIGRVNMIIAICEEQGIRTSIIPIYNDYLPSSASVDVVGNMRLINIRANSQDIVFNRILKRSFDLVFSSAIILLTSPLLLIITVCVRLSSPGPVLFRQERVGRDGKPFIMYKFRSMRVNSESDTRWSKQRDSRVTGFGAFIRKLSLDELPQFFNVIKGDMSVVGPRPELPYFVEQYKYQIPRYMVKHQVKPGITGWAQVNGFRGDTSIAKRIDYDLWYIEHWSFGLDIKIILMTVFGGMMNEEKNMSRDSREQDT